MAAKTLSYELKKKPAVSFVSVELEFKNKVLLINKFCKKITRRERFFVTIAFVCKS